MAVTVYRIKVNKSGNLDFFLEVFYLFVLGPNTMYNSISSGVVDIQIGTTFNSSGPSLAIMFNTNSFGQFRGFELSYESIDRGMSSNDYCTRVVAVK